MTGRQWVEKQARDVFVQQSRRQGYVARSAFKLIELDDKFGLFQASPSVDRRAGAPHSHSAAAGAPPSSPPLERGRPQAVLDLGCSPGSWCQVMRERCGEECQLFAVDLLPVKASVPNTTFIQGDFTDPAVQRALLSQLYAMPDGGGRPEAEAAGPSSRGVNAETGLLDVVTSDMCPNRMGGTGDRQRQMALQLEALTFSLPLLRPGGHFVCKTLGSRTSQAELWQLMSRWFRRVSAMKPLASREHSDEEFLVGREKLLQPRAPIGSSHFGKKMVPATRGSFGLDDWPGLSRLPRRRKG